MHITCMKFNPTGKMPGKQGCQQPGTPFYSSRNDENALFAGFTSAILGRKLNGGKGILAMKNKSGEIIPSSLKFQNGTPLNEKERECAVDELIKSGHRVEGHKISGRFGEMLPL